MKKKYSLGLYEKALPDDLNWKDKAECCKAAGFDRLELSIDESDWRLARLENNSADYDSFCKEIINLSVPVRSLCLSAHRKYPLGSHDVDIRKRSLDIMDKALVLADRLGIRMIQLAGYDVYYEESDQQSETYFRENLKNCIEMAARHGIILAFETMETAFMDTVTKGMKYIRIMNSPFLQMYPDIGNLNNSAILYGHSIRDDLLQGKGAIVAAHLKETKPGVYRNMNFGSGCTDYSNALEELWQQGVRFYTAECWYLGSPDWESELKLSSCFLRQKIEEAAK